MKKYRVIVDGIEYEVGVELMDEADAKAGSASPPPKKFPEQKTAAPVANGNGDVIRSPMPGNILSVSVQNGSPVKKGQVLMILEAMKMENEIIAPRDAVVASVSVRSGMSVDTGAVLCSLE